MVPFSSVSAHNLENWANYYPAINANSTNSFGIENAYHINGRIANYYWANTTAKNYFNSAFIQGENAWGGMIDVVETSSSDASFVIKYNPNIASNSAAYVQMYGPSYGHYASNEIVTELVY